MITISIWKLILCGLLIGLLGANVGIFIMALAVVARINNDDKNSGIVPNIEELKHQYFVENGENSAV